jgi:hypothetical protein
MRSVAKPSARMSQCLRSGAGALALTVVVAILPAFTASAQELPPTQTTEQSSPDGLPASDNTPAPVTPSLDGPSVGTTSDLGSSSPAHPKEKPIGVSLETLSSRGNAVVVDGIEQPNTSDRNGIFLTVLDAATRNLLESGTVPNNASGLNQLLITANAVHPKGSIFIISSAHGINAADRAMLTRVAAAVGASFTDAEFGRLTSNASFSIVGLSGAGTGTGWTKVAPTPPLPGDGNITGMLRWNPDGLRYDFVPGRPQTISTSVPDGSPPGTRFFNVVGVGNGTFYDSDNIGANASGFHIVSLDPQTLALRRNVTVVTSASPQSLSGQLSAAAQPLPGELAPLVVVQSMGRPTPSPFWNDAAKVIEQLGGSPLTFLNMDKAPAADYALIGSLSAGTRSTESAAVMGVPSPAVGVLGPVHDMTYLPLVAGPIGTVNIDQVNVVNQAPRDFPSINTAAENWIGFRLNICGDPGRVTTACDIRTRYGSDFEKRGSDWADLATRAELLTYESGHGFTDTEFSQTRDLLKVELRSVASVHRYYTFLQKIFSTAGGAGRVNVKPVGDTIFNSINPDGAIQVEANMMQFIDKAVNFVSLFFPAIKPVTSNLLGAYSFTSYLSSKTGPTATPANPVKVRGDQLTRQIADALAAAADNFDTEARIVATDPGKLAAAAQAIDSEEWALPDSSAEAVRALELGSKAWFAKALLPTAYPWLIRTTPPPLGTTDLNKYSCKLNTPPWKGAHPNLQLSAVQGFGADATPFSPIFFPSRDNPMGYNTDNERNARANTPSNEVVELLFGTGPGQLRINKFEFYAPRYFGALHNANVGAERCDLYRRGPSEPGPNLPDAGSSLPNVGSLLPDTGSSFLGTGPA